MVEHTVRSTHGYPCCASSLSCIWSLSHGHLSRIEARALCSLARIGVRALCSLSRIAVCALYSLSHACSWTGPCTCSPWSVQQEEARGVTEAGGGGAGHNSRRRRHGAQQHVWTSGRACPSGCSGASMAL
jgi:hypothetical protein